ncbi:MAG: PAP2 superfamily [Bacteroidetes bacterium HLUCCA01]|nr:MAG: PAP2 superfamily [Bacteroidetes bacterium HLUCCA01]
MPSTPQRQRLARVITNTLNPLVLPVVLFSYAASRLEADGRTIFLVIATGIIFYSIIPLLILLSMRRNRRIDTMEVERRELRLRPFIYGILSMLTGATLFTLLGFKNGEAYQALGMIPIVNAMLAAFITLRWKISVHAISVTTAAVTMWYLSGPLVLSWPPITLMSILSAFLLSATIVLVQWSRVVLNYHTPGQVAAGCILAAGMTVLQLYVYFPEVPLRYFVTL